MVQFILMIFTPTSSSIPSRVTPLLPTFCLLFYLTRQVQFVLCTTVCSWVWDLAGDTPLKKICSPFLRSHQLPIAAQGRVVTLWSGFSCLCSRFFTQGLSTSAPCLMKIKQLLTTRQRIAFVFSMRWDFMSMALPSWVYSPTLNVPRSLLIVEAKQSQSQLVLGWEMGFHYTVQAGFRLWTLSFSPPSAGITPPCLSKELLLKK